MKNLKKVLALVLALATVMGLGVTASAKTYTDSSKIEYTEAVDVMSAIGILDGNPDGSFNPQGNLTRVQAAKMVAYLLNGGKDVNDLYSGANTFVDCYNSWGKGYIAYVNQMGIVSGVGNGKFNPNGTLTGVALAKMMLTSLGYDADVEGYQNNNNWQVNIINDAKDAGLLKGLDSVNLYTAITREQASQMMFNALKATMVRYDNKGSEIDLGNGVVIRPDGGDAEAVVNNESSYKKSDVIDDKFTGTMQLCEKYFEDLKLTAGASDAFGRQGNKWEYNKSAIGTYGTTADYTVVLDKDYSAKNNATDFLKVLQDLTGNDDLSLYTVGAVDDVELYINGKDMSQQDFDSFVKAGATVELFCEGDVIKSVVAYTTDLVKITDVDTDVKDADAKKGVTAYVDIDGVADDINNTDIPGFDAKTYVEGAYIAVVVDDDDNKTILSSYVPEAVEGSMSAYNAQETVTFAGTKYTLAGNFVDSNNMLSGDFDSTYTLYIDNNGYAMGAVLKTAVVTRADYAYVNGIDLAAGKFDDLPTAQAKLTYLDGTSKVVDLQVKETDDGYTAAGIAFEDAEANMSSAEGKLYTVKTNTDGVVTGLNDAKGSKNVLAVKAGEARVSNSADTWNANHGVADSNTVLTLIKDGKVTTYTGYKNFPNETFRKEQVDGIFVVKNSDETVITDIIVIGGSAKVDTTYAYALGKVQTDSNGDLYAFYVNGEKVEYYYSTGTEPVAGTVYSLSVSGNEFTVGNATNATAGQEIKTVGETYIVLKSSDTYVYMADDCVVYDVTGDDLKTGTLKAGQTITICKDSDNEKAVEIYITAK